MDTAYDRIQEEALPAEAQESDPRTTSNNLNSELQEAFKAVSASPWGATLGGWFGQVRKQGETLYQDLQKEATEASTQASKRFSTLREQVVSGTSALSLGAGLTTASKDGDKEGSSEEKGASAEGEAERSDIVKEATNLVASLRSTAAAKLKDLQRAEDAADEALLKFGLNVRNFLREAVTITAPGEEYTHSEVIFETKDGSGKKIFHSTRLDAQLHAIHSSRAGFTMDPSGPEWKQWEAEFDVDKQTPQITADLEKYDELRRAFEWSVPERADYRNFWMRYYFLRKAIDEEERRRKEVLKGAAADTEEEVGWDDDEEEEEGIKPGHKASESTTTLSGPAASDLLKPGDGRRSDEERRSVADSDASYDMMTASGATSRAAGSPRLEASKKDAGKEDDDDDDWE